MPDSQVDWYGERVILEIEGATDAVTEALAFQLEAQAKVNIRDNGQIVTGFMLNSTYVVLPERDTYGNARASSEAANPDAEMAPPAQLEDGARAGVVVGADYAIFQEMLQSFLFRAAEQIAAVSEATIQRVARERGLTE